MELNNNKIVLIKIVVRSLGIVIEGSVYERLYNLCFRREKPSKKLL